MSATTTTPTIYFAVPGHYTIGDVFSTIDEAVAHAQSQIRPIEGTESFTRAFVDVRVSDAEGDRSVYRFEVSAA